MSSGEMILTPEDAALLLMLLRDGSITWWGQWEDREEWKLIRQKLEACAALVPPPLNGDKVWHGLTTGLRRTGTYQNQSETVVRARNKAEAIRLLCSAGENITAYQFNGYWGITGNRESLCAAKERGVYVKGPEGWIKK